MTDIKALRKRAMHDPQSLTQEEWDAIYKVAFTVPKKDFSDPDSSIISSPIHKQKKKGSWW